MREHELEDNMQLLRQRGEIEQKMREVRRKREELRTMGLERYEE